MNEYEIAFYCGLGLSAFCIIAYVLSWVVQWAWAWIDDGKASKKNWIASKTIFSKWKYPVHNDYGDALERKAKTNADGWGYAKDKKHTHKSVHNLKHGIDYLYDWQISGRYFWLVLGMIPLPVVAVLMYDVYPITLTIGVLIVLAYLARFSRRHKKIFDEHVKDKGAHK